MILWAVYGHRILVPYFIKDDAQNQSTVNQEHYREIILLLPHLCRIKTFCRIRNLPLQRQWMQQDGAHMAEESLACLQHATTPWWLLNFPWNRISVPFTLPGSPGPRCLYMRHAERISFPIRWPTWKCSIITGEDTIIFCVLATTCVHQHV